MPVLTTEELPKSTVQAGESLVGTTIIGPLHIFALYGSARM